ncbi:phytanoyl-CoA dioxygenase [Pelomonas sp. HMWF004]|nr:phytanoyl-CoA dioxygenase [Pelomonas sp. HMWF004]
MQVEAVEDVLPLGFKRLNDVLDAAARQAVIDKLAALPAGSAGQRDLLDLPWCCDLSQRLRRLPEVQACLPAGAVAVQCTLFEKSPDRNWLVPPHQDLAIPVAHRVEHPQLRGWSVKEGRHFVLAPAEVLDQVLGLRLHLDDAAQADGGLRFIPGSHRAGVLDEREAALWRQRVGEVSADAHAGDVLLMRPLALHASSKATAMGRRRVLHFVFGPAELPFGLQWPAVA